MTTKIKARTGVSDSFEVKIGMHQGSALSPYLFILVPDELLKGVVKEVPGVCCSRINGTNCRNGARSRMYAGTGENGTGKQGFKDKQRKD